MKRILLVALLGLPLVSSAQPSTNISATSPTGVTNILYRIITNAVGDGNILKVVGNTITGVPPGGGGATNAINSLNGLTNTSQLLTISDGLEVSSSGSTHTFGVVSNRTLPYYINIKDAPYNAVDDGITDSTAIFQTAINFASSNHAIIYIPKPTNSYLVNLLITNSFVHLIGVGHSIGTSTNGVLRPFDTTKPVVQIGNDTALVDGTMIENLGIIAEHGGTNCPGALHLLGGANYGSFINLGLLGGADTLKLMAGTNQPVSLNTFLNCKAWEGTNRTIKAVYPPTGSYTTGNHWIGGYVNGHNTSGFAVEIDKGTPFNFVSTYFDMADNRGFYLTNGPTVHFQNCPVEVSTGFGLFTIDARPGTHPDRDFTRYVQGDANDFQGTVIWWDDIDATGTNFFTIPGTYGWHSSDHYGVYFRPTILTGIDFATPQDPQFNVYSIVVGGTNVTDPLIFSRNDMLNPRFRFQGDEIGFQFLGGTNVAQLVGYDFLPLAGGDTNTAAVEFFRGTSRTNALGINIHQGINGYSLQTRLGANGDSWLNSVLGNVGIGTQSPTNKLHVAGNSTITGDLDVNGGITVGSGNHSLYGVQPGSNITIVTNGDGSITVSSTGGGSGTNSTIYKDSTAVNGANFLSNTNYQWTITSSTNMNLSSTNTVQLNGDQTITGKKIFNEDITFGGGLIHGVNLGTNVGNGLASQVGPVTLLTTNQSFSLNVNLLIHEFAYFICTNSASTNILCTFNNGISMNGIQIFNTGQVVTNVTVPPNQYIFMQFYNEDTLGTFGTFVGASIFPTNIVQLSDFNTNQFSTNNGTWRIALKSGAALTNASLTTPADTGFTNLNTSGQFIFNGDINIALTVNFTNDWSTTGDVHKTNNVSASFTVVNIGSPSIGSFRRMTINNTASTNVIATIPASLYRDNLTYTNWNVLANSRITFEWLYNGADYWIDTAEKPNLLLNNLALFSESTTNGMVSKTGPTNFAFRIITNGVGVVVDNGDGVSGNPSIRHNIEAGSNITISTNGGALVIASSASGSGNVVFTDFNTNQFNTNNGTWKLALKHGALTTNQSFAGPLLFPAGTESTNLDWSTNAASAQGLTTNATFTNTFVNYPPAVGASLSYSVQNTATTNILMILAVANAAGTNNVLIPFGTTNAASITVPAQSSLIISWYYNGTNYYADWIGKDVGTNQVMRTRSGLVRAIQIQPDSRWFTNGISVPATNLATTGWTNTAGNGILFADGVTNTIRRRISLPPNWDAGTLRLQLTVGSTLTNTTSNTNIVLGAKFASLPANTREDSAPTFGTQVTVTNHIHKSQWQPNVCITSDITPGNTPAANKDLLLELTRMTSDATDVMTNTVVLLNAVLFYTESTTEPSMPASTN